MMRDIILWDKGKRISFLCQDNSNIFFYLKGLLGVKIIRLSGVYSLKSGKFFVAKGFPNNLKQIITILRKSWGPLNYGNYCELEFRGLGYRWWYNEQDRVLWLSLGYSHYIKYHVAKGIVIICRKKRLLVFGYEKAKVTRIAKEIRGLKFPDAYKGKGIIYEGEDLILKEGKQR